MRDHMADTVAFAGNHLGIAQEEVELQKQAGQLLGQFTVSQYCLLRE